MEKIVFRWLKNVATLHPPKRERRRPLRPTNIAEETKSASNYWPLSGGREGRIKEFFVGVKRGKTTDHS